MRGTKTFVTVNGKIYLQKLNHGIQFIDDYTTKRAFLNDAAIVFHMGTFTVVAGIMELACYTC